MRSAESTIICRMMKLLKLWCIKSVKRYYSDLLMFWFILFIVCVDMTTPNVLSYMRFNYQTYFV